MIKVVRESREYQWACEIVAETFGVVAVIDMA